MKRTRDQLSEIDFDLADIRKAKRRLKQALAEIERIEKRLVKKRPKPRAGSKEEIALALEMYRKADEFARKREEEKE